MSKDTFFKDSLILTLTNSTTGLLKFVFAIILSKQLGAEGMGLYGLIMPIYDLFCCLVCGGMIASISKQCSIYHSKYDIENLNKCVETSLFFILFWSSIIAIFIFIKAPYISSHIIKDPRSIYSIKAICPAIIFIALSSILKGYFYGISKVKIPAIIDIFEKTIRISVIISIISIFSLTQITKTVTSVYISLSVGEFVSFIFLYIFYKINKNKLKYNFRSKIEGRAQLLFNVLLVSVPLCINGFLTTAISSASTLLLPRRLIKAGLNYNVALSMIGRFSGMALSIIFFPFVIITSMSIVLIPDLSQSLSNKNYFALEKRIQNVLKISFFIGISTLAICFSIPETLGKLFFNQSDLALYIKMAALCAPFSYIAATTYTILNGIGKQGVLLRNSIITALEELILLYILTAIPSINILGYAISLIITSLTGLILNLHEIKKMCYIKILPINIITDILLGILTYIIIIILDNILPDFNFTLRSILLILSGFSIYLFPISSIDKE